MKTYFTYILKCSDGSFYTGITNDLDARLSGHQRGLNSKSYTYSRRPVKLVYSNDFYDVNEAISLEKQIKGWSRRKKIALIEGRIDDLIAIANENNYNSPCHLEYTEGLS
ncbi:GIY-YIG nuclease family protein [Candidatus Falkowbacteria bacterium]|jgi:putative endonuclease|nr:GIY-YIG nuclease family protein [Candidatus Falkowbacteria bacterium]MBT5503344.1 GIY-YIG nuclease family protein [Candidatus Falkowbacteria bacterium]MBT6573675.1 GIY-YIG nuclease family protein [Candidatus Falkowbacteria bacterium]MBT7500146.1 GIY-YIG nuclease family protein [Candidatus Falkowbacteria bacterium]